MTESGSIYQNRRQYATLKQAAEYLNVTDRTIRQMIADGRLTVFGNPWAVVGAGTEPRLFGGRERVYTVEGPGNYFRGTYTQHEAAQCAIDLYRDWINSRRPTAFRGAIEPLHARLALRDLRGHDLSCWCSPDSPCHATVLLELCERMADA